MADPAFAPIVLEPEPRVPCASCEGPLVDRYYLSDSGLLCSTCATAGIAADVPGSVFDATLQGMLALLVMTLLWAALTYITGYEFGVVGIVVGAAIGVAVRHGAGGRNDRMFRWMAVGMTYLAISVGTLGYTLMVHHIAVDALDIVFLVVAWPVILTRSAPQDGILGLIILGVALQAAWWASAAPAKPAPYMLTRGGVNPPGHALCHACGAGFPATFMVCPGCGVYARMPEIEALLAQAHAAQARGDNDAALQALRAVHLYLPAHSANEARVGKEIDRL